MTPGVEDPLLPADSTDAIELVAAIQRGDLAWIARALNARPTLAVSRIASADGSMRTPLHVVTDWPGYFENGPAVTAMLLAAGADPNASVAGRHAETPLHWAASNDDVDVAVVLLDGGADIEAPGGSISGTPLANAVGYGCWRVARLLVSRGARVESLWQAAALGMHGRVDELLAAVPAPTPDQITEAFWQACHGGERRMAARLLALGADANAPPGYFARQSAVDVASGMDTGRERLVAW